MIIIDTNVLSALMRADPKPVLAWVDAQPEESIWTSAITLFEVRFGLALLPRGRRRTGLERAFVRAVDELLGGRVVFFDRNAADAAGAIGAARQQQGRTIKTRDLLIAGIAAARKATLATRNTRHFADTGIALADPWQA